MLSDLRKAVALLVVVAPAALSLACASQPSGSGQAASYLRWATFKVPVNEHVLLRWPKEKMPLRVHLPDPPTGLFEDPRAIFDSVRDGVLGWTDAAGPGIPSFVFVDDAGDADIPIVWAKEPDGDWYIAYCAWDIQPFSRRFGVSQILVTGRWDDAYVADRHEVFATVLHEMGHALGIGGHSPDQGDIMYSQISGTATGGLSQRDRATLAALYARPIGTRVAGGRGAR
jgi:predicted Zn-dependent protease